MVPLNQKKEKAPIKGAAKDALLEEMEFSMLSKLILEWMNVTKGNRAKEKLKKKRS